jgi:hypothetical protein
MGYEFHEAYFGMGTRDNAFLAEAPSLLKPNPEIY